MSEALKNTHKYDDIIDHAHHVSARHPQMTAEERAAQFSPFAALTGYGEVIRKTGERHEKRMELGEGVSRETYNDKYGDA